MSWPSTRLTTYAAGSKVKSNDLNALQDAVIAGRHGSLDIFIPPRPILLTSGSISSESGDGYIVGDFVGTLQLPGTYDGVRLTGCKLLSVDTAGNFIAWAVRVKNLLTGAVVNPNICDTMNTSQTGAYQVQSATGFVATTLSDRSVQIYIDTNNAAHEIHGAVLTLDVP